MTEKATRRAEVSRYIDASPERVFDAWLDPEKAAQFLFVFPGGEIIRIEIDAQVGGRYTFVMKRGEQTLTHTGEYLEIDRPRRLVFSFAVLELSPNYDRVTIDFAAEGEGCRIHLANEMAAEDWEEWGKQTEEGWTAILNTLAASLEN